MPVTHNFVSAISDDPAAAAAGQVLPSHWNDGHDVQVQVAEIDATGTADNTTFLRGDGAWATPAAASLAVGTTSITGGTAGNLLYNNSGTLGGVGSTGTGDVVRATSATLVTPALGTPSALTLTNATGLPVSGLTGLGTNVATALAVNVGSSGAFVTYGGALGTPSSGTLTNATGLPVGGISATGTPSASNYLRGDGSWQSVSASPGGSDTHVQYNDGGSFGGEAAFTYNKSTNLLSVEKIGLGTAGSALGVLTLSGNTSGTVTVQTAAAAGTYTLTLPVDDGTASQVLTTDGSGVLSWATPSGGGSKTIRVFTPLDNQPPASNFATLDTRNSIAVLDFDGGSTNEEAVFVGVIPEGASLTSGIKVRIFWMATSATSGDCRWGAQFEKYGTDNDSDSYDTAVEGHTTCSGTSGIAVVTELTVTTIDSLAAGDQFRVKVYRDASDTTNDTMTGDAELIAVELRAA